MWGPHIIILFYLEQSIINIDHVTGEEEEEGQCA
jgi:hypothetical protein